MNEIDDKYETFFKENSKNKNLPNLDYKPPKDTSLINETRKKAITEFQSKISHSHYTAPQQTESYFHTHNSFLFKQYNSDSSSQEKKFEKKYVFKIFFCFKISKKILPHFF